MFEKKLLTDEFGPFDSFSTQVTYPACSGNRYDFALHTSTSMTLVEVKNVVGAEYVTGAVPSCRSHVGVYCVEPSELPKTGRKPHERHAIFPHGAKKNDIGVVSDRAIKHVHHLTELHGTTDPCTGKQVQLTLTLTFTLTLTLTLTLTWQIGAMWRTFCGKSR